jgi:AcrR family transcriptional regulator
MMDRFERRKEQSKEYIRRAAVELFAKFGADKVSINDIARKAGVSQATIYNNFGNKENLVHDYHSTIVRKIASSFRGIIVMKKSWVDKFQSFLQSWIDVADQGDAKSLDSVGGEIEDSFREFIKEGKEQGSLRSDLSNEAIMTYIKFFQQGISHNPGIRDRIAHDPKLSDDLLSLFIYGVSGKVGDLQVGEQKDSVTR